jgi:thiol-disulfide isomerase/thioredoxin
MRAAPLLVVLLAACAAPQRPAPTALPRVLVYAPDAATPIDLVELAAGRPLVVDVLATWCEACRELLPSLNELARSGTVRVVGLDAGEGRAAVERWAARAGVGYPVYYDPELRFEDSLGVAELPLVLVFDAGGRLVHRSSHLDDATRAAIRDLVPTAASR